MEVTVQQGGVRLMADMAHVSSSYTTDFGDNSMH